MEKGKARLFAWSMIMALFFILLFPNLINAASLTPETKKRLESVSFEQLIIPPLSSKQQAKLDGYKANLPLSTPSYYDLKPYQTRAKNQNPRGSCPTFAFIGALEAAYVREYGLHSENISADGLSKWGKYAITNDCSLICLTPECFAGCEEFDLSEEYYAHISLSTQSASNPLLSHENIASECFTEEDTEGVDSTVMFTVSGLTVPREKYAPYFGNVNANNNSNHSGDDYYQLMFDTGIFRKDALGNYECNPNPTQKEIDDFNYDSAHIPPAARKNAIYGVTDLQVISASDARNSDMMEKALFNKNEVDLGFGLGGLDCGNFNNGTTYQDGSPVQTYSDGNRICRNRVHLCPSPPYGAAGCQGLNEGYDSTGDWYEAGHQMLLVGYDRANQLFLLKNSWGDYLSYIWVSYDYFDEKCYGGYIITGVRDPELGPSPEAMWIGRWRMDRDGYVGNLVIRRTRPMPVSDAPGEYGGEGYGSNTRLGSYYASDGVYHAVTGYEWANIDTLSLFIDFDETEGGPYPLGTPIELKGQEFTIELFVSPSNTTTYGNFAAGTTTWNSTLFGTMLSRSHIDIPYHSGSFTMDKWKDTYKLYYSGGSEASFEIMDIGEPGSSYFYPVTAQHNETTGSIAAIDDTNYHYLWLWGSSDDFYYHTWETGIISGRGHFGMKIADMPYSGIWKGDAGGISYSFYIQHYATGATIVIYASDPNRLYGFLSDMFGGCTFETDSMEPSRAKGLRIRFSSENQGIATLTDNTKNPTTSIEIPILKEFPAKETQHSGIWKDLTGAVSFYLQDYEAGSTVVVYTKDAMDYYAFLADMDGMTFSAQHIAGSGQELTLHLTGTDTGTMNLSTTAGETYQIQKLFPPVSMDVDFTGAPLSGPAPLQVRFSDLSSVTHTGWLWDFGDGETSNEQNPKHTYWAPGTYSVSMVASIGNASTETLRSDYIQVSSPTDITIAGTITFDGVGLRQVTVNVGGAAIATDDQGHYSIVLLEGWSGTITPSKAGYLFEPPSVTYINIMTDQTNLNFTARR